MNSKSHLARRAFGAREELHRALFLGLTLLATAASAQTMGQGLISYAQPIILSLIGFAVIIGLVGSVFNPMLLKHVAYALIIGVVVFGILRGMSALLSAIQQG